MNQGGYGMFSNSAVPARGSSIQEMVAVPEDLVEWVESPQIASTFVDIKKATGANYLVIVNEDNKVCILVDAPDADIALITRKHLEMYFLQRRKMISAEVNKSNTLSKLYQAQGDMAAGSIVEFYVEEDLLGFVIGKGGKHIQDVENSCKIKSINVGENGRIVIIGGDHAEVAKAREMLEMKRDFISISSVHYDFMSREPSHLNDMKITADLAVCRLSERSKCSIIVIGTDKAVGIAKKLSPTHLDCVTKLMEIKGSERAAYEELRDFDRQYGGGGRGGAGGRGGGGRGNADYGGRGSSGRGSSNRNAGRGGRVVVITETPPPPPPPPPPVTISNTGKPEKKSRARKDPLNDDPSPPFPSSTTTKAPDKKDKKGSSKANGHINANNDKDEKMEVISPEKKPAKSKGSSKDDKTDTGITNSTTKPPPKKDKKSTTVSTEGMSKKEESIDKVVKNLESMTLKEAMDAKKEKNKEKKKGKTEDKRDDTVLTPPDTISEAMDIDENDKKKKRKDKKKPKEGSGTSDSTTPINVSAEAATVVPVDKKVTGNKAISMEEGQKEMKSKPDKGGLKKTNDKMISGSSQSENVPGGASEVNPEIYSKSDTNENEKKSKKKENTSKKSKNVNVNDSDKITQQQLDSSGSNTEATTASTSDNSAPVKKTGKDKTIAAAKNKTPTTSEEGSAIKETVEKIGDTKKEPPLEKKERKQRPSKKTEEDKVTAATTTTTTVPDA